MGNKRVIEYSELVIHYQKLFTNKQRQYLFDYFLNDLSFNEVARKHRVTAMAVADSIKHSKIMLNRYEQALHLAKLSQRRQLLYNAIKDQRVKKLLLTLEENTNA